MTEKPIVEEICKVLKKTNALDFGAYKLSSGKITPYYVDLRVIPSFPDAFKAVTDILTNTVERVLDINGFNRIAGIPMSWDPFRCVVGFSVEQASPLHSAKSSAPR